MKTEAGQNEHFACNTVDSAERNLLTKSRDHDVVLENALSYDKHISKKCQITYVQPKNLKGHRTPLPQKPTATLVTHESTKFTGNFTLASWKSKGYI